MNLREEDKGIAMMCSPDGTIVHIIRDEIGLPKPLPPGTTFASLMDKSSNDEAQRFLAMLNERHAAFDYRLAIKMDGGASPMHFVGTVDGDRMFIIGARSCSGLTRFEPELMLINNEQANAPRAAFKEMSLQVPREMPTQKFYDDFSRLNNDLANLQREMVRKNIELEKMNEQKNRILGMAAHDLRSPLGIIQSYSEFLESEAGELLNEEQREFVTIIKDTSEYMLRMVTDLLDVSAIESGQLTLDQQPIDLEPLILRCVKLNRILAARKKISLKIDPIPELPPIPMDSGKIEQAFNNLLNNAIKFSHGDREVCVSVTLSNDFVMVAVRDQGQGIPAADLPKLFKVFGKTSVRSTAGEKSTGLGLAIVRKIVEGHGGRIWVESEVNQGSTFFFTLPIAPSSTPSAASAHHDSLPLTTH